MPLHMEEDFTSRTTIIPWDPDVAVETREAKKRISQLKKKGFIVTKKEPGQVTLEPPPKPKHIGLMRVLTKNGDDRITWDRTKPKEIADAIKKFDSLKGQGYKAFAISSTGKKGHEIQAFDPGAEEVLMVPATRPS